MRDHWVKGDRRKVAELNEGAIAQLGERYNGIVEVSGSIPLSSTNFPRGNPATMPGGPGL